MDIQARYDLDVVALQSQDDLTCLLTLTAPEPEGLAQRPAETLIAVLDNSGSMSGHRLAAAKHALHELVERLKPQDTFGVVTFSSDARICVPTGRIGDQHLPGLHARIESVVARSSTDLSAGYLLGLAQAERHSSATGSSLVLLSDGHANAGVTDRQQLGSLAAQGRSKGTTTVTIGIGDGYDETLMSELATHGQGSHRFAFTPDDAVAVVSEEAGDLLSKAIVNAFLRIRPALPGLIDGIGTLHDVPRWIEDSPTGPVVTIPLGDLYAGQSRELLVRFAVPRIDVLGPTTIGTFILDYVALPGLQARTVNWPITVNVVSDDERSARLPDPTVTTALLLAEVTSAKKDASDALGQGDGDRAEAIMASHAERVRASAKDIADRHPDRVELAARLAEEAEQLERLAAAARHRSMQYSRKSLMEDISMNARGRDDQVRRGRARKRWEDQA
ncbi:MAG: VWA domain-containing protein [Actinomycetales bacterium]|nr:VWA domain-containing protein [Actinomycetales bacterium]